METKQERNFCRLRAVVGKVFEADGTYPREADLYYGLLDSLADDVFDGDRRFLGLRNAPAAVRNHHCERGGLVRHLLEMWEAYEVWRAHYSLGSDTPHLSAKRVLGAILFHDIHKAYRTFVQVGHTEWGAAYASRDKARPEITDGLMTETIKSIWILSKSGINLDPEMLNVLCLAHGGWSEIKPRRTTVLAKLVYLLDEFSGNVLDQIERGDFLDESRCRGSIR